MAEPIEICYLCGMELEGKIDRDHVPPKQFYATNIRKKHNPNLFTLPVHHSCNKAYQKDEDYFVHSIAPLTKESYSGSEIWKDITHKFQRPEGFRIGKMISKEFDSRPSGLYLPRGKVIKRFDAERVWRVVWKIVRGLFFKEHQRLLPENNRLGDALYISKFTILDLRIGEFVAFFLYYSLSSLHRQIYS